MYLTFRAKMRLKQLRKVDEELREVKRDQKVEIFSLEKNCVFLVKVNDILV